MIKSLKKFFGLGQSTKHRRHSHRATPQGNHALPREMQLEVMEAARQKRLRKQERNRITHFIQKKQGHHTFT